jgi:hypothetical protein
LWYFVGSFGKRFQNVVSFADDGISAGRETQKQKKHGYNLKHMHKKETTDTQVEEEEG